MARTANSPSLTRFGSAVPTVFGLFRTDENSATGALGWTLSQSLALLTTILRDLLPSTNATPRRIDLQRSAEDKGFTDIEIYGDDFHVVMEAKVGLVLPSAIQLERYARRLESAVHRLIVAVSESPSAYARQNLPAQVRGVEVTHRTWKQIRRLVNAAHGLAHGPIEKLWLRQLSEHLEDYVTGRRETNNSVYVLALSKHPIRDRSKYTWIDVVDGGHYFHPIGKNWPPEPPNYIGFRYDGRLQSIHHIDEWNIVDRLRAVDKHWPTTNKPHFVYTLGPAIVPQYPVKTGKLYMNGRVWAAIDLLLSGTCDTISEAAAETRKRMSQL